jgi:AraC-like DNA-binding protein
MRAIEFVESYFDAWNHHDPKGVADHLTADGIYRDIPEKVERSHDELIQSLSNFFSSNNHRYELIGEVLASPNSLSFQYGIFPHGESGAYRGAEFMTLNGDAAMTIIDYYDVPGDNRPLNLAAIASNDARQKKYAKSGLSVEQMQQYKDHLKHVMCAEQLFLRSNLTLPRLAREVDCSVNHLSQVINSGFGMSFFDYLNQYRVQHATHLLTSRDAQNNAILNIAFAVGFNSNSAFYAAFKKCVGQTPAQYRHAQLEEPH